MHDPSNISRKQYTASFGRHAASRRMLSSERRMMARTLPLNRTMGGGRVSPRDETGLSTRKYSPYNDISSPHPGTPATSTMSRYSTPMPSNPRHFESRPLQLKTSSAIDSAARIALPFESVLTPRQREIRPGGRIRYELNCSPKEMPSSSTWISNQKENESAAGNKNDLSSPSPRYSLDFEPRASALEIRPFDTLNSGGRTSTNNYALESRARGYPTERNVMDSRSSFADSALLDRYSSTVGLVNLGNTCFMNAALQCIAHTPSLAQYFLSDKHTQDNTNEDKLVSSFADVVRGIYTENGRRGSAFSPSRFLRDLIEHAPQFDGGRQHDCHEFIRVLIDQLSEDLCTSDKNQPNLPMTELDNLSFLAAANYSWKQHLSKNSSFITNEFCGQLVSTLECSVCHSERYTFDPFYDLSIPFPEAKTISDVQHNRRHSRYPFIKRLSHHDKDLSSCSLDECLRAFTEPEVLDGDNMTECSHCQQKRESTKRLQVYRFPRVLVLHLKRFGNDRKKIRASVEFPIVGFDASGLAIDSVNQRPHVPIYDLFALCEHSGRMNYGHYTSTCLDASSNRWYEFNDNIVTAAEPEDCQQNAYILFYKQRSS